MKILFLGDIVGRLGRQTVGKILPELKKSAKITAVFANAENAAHGRGATKSTIDELSGFGIDYFTGGNHLFWHKGFSDELEENNLPVLRPANYPEEVPGRGAILLDFGRAGKVLLVNLEGRTFLNRPVNCPFRTIDRILEENQKEESLVIIVDFHAEATSEKLAMGFYLDGRASAVLGTHTHIPTADERLLPKGTAYVTDVGMVGAWDSVLGVKKEIIIENLKSPLPRRFEWEEEGPTVFNSVFIEIGRNGKAKAIERVDKVAR